MKKIIVIIFIISFFVNCVGQNCNYIKDTLFFISICVFEKGQMPIVGCGLIKSLKELDFNKNSVEEFSKSVYKTIIYTTDAGYGFLKMQDCYREGYKEFEKSTAIFMKHQKKMIKKQFVCNFMLKDSSYIEIDVAKINGEFWKLPKDFKLINGFSPQIMVDENIYSYDYFFRFKTISKCYKLSKKEKLEIMQKTRW